MDGRGRLRLLSLVVAMTCLISGCASSLPSPSADKSLFQPDGVLMIARPLPSPAQVSAAALGFVPITDSLSSAPATGLGANGERAGVSLMVNIKDKTLVVKDGDKVVITTKADGSDKLRPGTYAVLYKQRGPTWYAPDSYFKARDQKVPPEGDKSRYLRGALGDFAIYLDKTTPIHGGPFWIPDIGGIRLDPSDISRVFYSLSIGATVEVR